MYQILFDLHTTMRKLLLYITIVSLPTTCLAQLTPAPTHISPTPSTEKAIATATAFMNAIIRDSSIDNLVSLCSLPFCHDDSVILTTHTELRNALRELISAVAKDRARMHPRVDSAYV